MTGPASTDCDVLIAGGGLVGSLLANALSALPLSVVLVETRRIDTLEQPSFDSRATALANGSQRVLQQLGLWDSISPEAQPIRRIHIGERGRFGAARIDAAEERVDALGYTVENRVLGKAFWAPLESGERFRCVAPADVLGLETSGDAVTVSIGGEDGRHDLSCRLLVAADGARSGLRAAVGIAATVDDYDQCALIVNCTTTEAHRGRAFERFSGDGPLAVLPLTGSRVAVVWVMPVTAAETQLHADDDSFRSALQAAFGYRLGLFDTIGRRDLHPLFRVRSADLVRQRMVLIGNAANALHPVAGQGFNLALRDVASLAELIADAVAAADGPADVGAESLLDNYAGWRAADQRKLASFTHALVRGFGADWPGARWARGAGLVAFDLLPGAKSLLARHTMGLAGHVPRLARQLALLA